MHDKANVEAAIADLKAVKDREDATAEEIRKAMDEVMNRFQKISEQMYQAAAQEQQAQGGAQEEPQDDNVVDADFTEVNDEK